VNTRRWQLALLLACACARSPEPRLYTLVARDGPARLATSAVVEVRRPHIAGYLDRREIVRSVLEQRLDIAGDALWAEPLDAMLGRVLARDLALRLPGSKVVTELSTLQVTPDVRIQLDVQRFESVANGALLLNALVLVRNSDSVQPPRLVDLELETRLAGRETSTRVAGMNELLGQLADQVARLIAAPTATP
jgi:uncharacterized lipoprotein YmbA